MPQVIVGLGNPGPAYRETRHNVGHHVVECVAKRLGARFRRRGSAVVAESEWAGQPVYLAKPVAYMNVIGRSVARLLRDVELDPTALIVVHDDLDLPFARVRVRHKGRHGGHNGVRSVIEALGTEQFRRVKVGVGRPPTKEEVVDWVLSPFAPDERRTLPAAIEEAADAALRLAAAAPEG